MSRIRREWSWPLVLAALGLPACASGAGGAAAPLAASWQAGELCAEVAACRADVARASERVLADLRLRNVRRQDVDSLDVVHASTEHGRSVVLLIADGVGAKSTIAVKIGRFGDEKLSRTIVERVIAALEDPGTLARAGGGAATAGESNREEKAG